MQNTPFSTNKTLNINGRIIDLTTPRIMGTLNITPDSFFDGGRFTTEKSIISHAEKLISEGADFIDVGGHSTRPGAAAVPMEEEQRRVVDAIRFILREFPYAIISVDTFQSAVAKAAVHAGASLINDVSAGNLDSEMFPTVAGLGVPYVAMHMRGTPQTMQSLTDYDDVITEVIGYFHPKIHELRRLGVRDIIVDPGFGFSKTTQQNFHILHHLREFSILERPLLVGLSRKSMVWRTLGVNPETALNGTTVLNTIACLNGADILRVHDVQEAREVIKLFTALRDNVPG